MANGQDAETPPRAISASPRRRSTATNASRSPAEFITLRAARMKAVLEECDYFIFPTEFLANVISTGADLCQMRRHRQRQVNPAPAFPPRASTPKPSTGSASSASSSTTRASTSSWSPDHSWPRKSGIPACGIRLEINGGNRHYATPAYLEKITALTLSRSRLRPGRYVEEKGRYARRPAGRTHAAVDWSSCLDLVGSVRPRRLRGLDVGRPVDRLGDRGLKERVADGVNGFTFPRKGRKGARPTSSWLWPATSRKWLKAHAQIKQP